MLKAPAQGFWRRGSPRLGQAVATALVESNRRSMEQSVPSPPRKEKMIHGTLPLDGPAIASNLQLDWNGKWDALLGTQSFRWWPRNQSIRRYDVWKQGTRLHPKGEPQHLRRTKAVSSESQTSWPWQVLSIVNVGLSTFRMWWNCQKRFVSKRRRLYKLKTLNQRCRQTWSLRWSKIR